MKTRKCKILYLTEDFILDIVNRFKFSGKIIDLPDYSNILPEGVEAVQAFYNNERCAFGIIITHPDFLEIPQNEIYPTIDFINLWKISNPSDICPIILTKESLIPKNTIKEKENFVNLKKINEGTTKIVTDGINEIMDCKFENIPPLKEEINEGIFVARTIRNGEVIHEQVGNNKIIDNGINKILSCEIENAGPLQIGDQFQIRTLIERK